MNLRQWLTRWLGRLTLPLRLNLVFFVMMYVLCIVTEWLTMTRGPYAHLYPNLFLECFLDLYVVCVVLTLLPRVARLWIRRLVYVVAYVLAVVDVFCFWKFSSTITPTMLLLVGETDGREAGEFLHQYVSAGVLLSPVGWILLLALLHVLVALLRRLWLARHCPQWLRGVRLAEEHAVSRWHGLISAAPQLKPLSGMVVLVLVVWSACSSFHNKKATVEIFSQRSVGGVEHALTDPGHAVFYTPLSRLLFSIYTNELASRQIEQLMRSEKAAVVDSCSYTSPTIVLIIGESYGKLHSQQYGYFMPTTPRQISREKTGRLVKFTDVVSPWNLTSFVFKNCFSTFVFGQRGEWCDCPLFPELFRKAGYRVTFLTNQFLPKAREAVYDFSGGFFLNNPKLSASMFDLRNDRLHQFDEGLFSDFDTLQKQGAFGRHNLIIFHLLGQHVSYKQRYPRDRRKFYADDYLDHRPDLSFSKRDMLSHYDNACLYNDSIVDQICQRFDDRDAIVIYMPDHGEECYEDHRNFICRNHSAHIDWPLAHYEFEIPFWIYCSHGYAVRHPEILREVVHARNRRFMTDALPHLLLYLGGIHSPAYHARYNVLSPDYDELRPRLLKNTVDYDQLRPTSE